MTEGEAPEEGVGAGVLSTLFALERRLGKWKRKWLPRPVEVVPLGSLEEA
ncbi:unnamed protein product [Protopolystoma xenopodis]|uniref:Uncharacterized protein n=1 Tax=Protopolystoma xenopodis TaxID=117903 RepID=A0A3S5BIA4_9PLAT|nr:unnamed protein product [Protopolystoma xenopodis]